MINTANENYAVLIFELNEEMSNQLVNNKDQNINLNLSEIYKVI